MKQILGKNVTKILLISATFCTLFGLAACGTTQENIDSTSDVQQIQYTIHTDLQDQTVELGERIQIPEAKLYDEDGNAIDKFVSMYVYDATGAIRANSPTYMKMTALGEWKVVYFYDNAEEVSVTLTCEDTNPPKVAISNYTRLATVGTEIALPQMAMIDFSEIDYFKSSLKMYYKVDGEWEDYIFDDFAQVFTPEDVGEYKIVLNAVDTMGNAKEFIYPVLIVEEGWQIPDLPENYVAAFNSDIYHYLINGSPSVAGGWWSGSSEPMSTYVTDIPGAENGDAVKIALERGANGAAFSLDLPKTDRESKDGDVLIARFKCDFYGHTFLQYSYDYQNVCRIGEADENGWRLAVIPIIDGNAYNLTSFTCLMSYAMDEVDYFYFDYIKVVEKLAVPTNLVMQSGLLTWDAVENADAYLVDLNGEIFEVTDNKCELPEGELVIRVKALNKANEYYESDYSNYIASMVGKAGYIADYNSEGYEKLVQTNVYGGGYWFPASYTAQYTMGIDGAKDGDALKIIVVGNSNNLAGIRINFPILEEGILGEYTSLVMRMKGIVVKPYVINDSWEADIPGYVQTSVDKEGWTIAVIPLWMVYDSAYNLRSMDFLFGAPAGQESEFYIDYVCVSQALSVPTGIALNGKQLTWNAVENAESYAVEINGELFTDIQATEYEVPNGPIYVRVKAVGNGINYSDSGWATISSILLAENELMTFDHEMYTEFIQRSDANINGNWKGNGWWIPSSLTAEYQADFEGSTNGALVMNYTPNSSSGVAFITISFTKAYNVADLAGDILLRYHGVESNYIVYDNSVDLPIDGVSSKDDGNGWWIVRIPKTSLYGTISAIGILGRGNQCAIDWIKVEKAFDVPTGLAYDKASKKLTWSMVEGANRYAVNVNGTDIEVNTNSYVLTCETSALVKVKALGFESFGDSSYSAVYQVNSKDGYIVDYDNASYETTVSNNAYGGGWWNPASLSAEYATGVEGAVNGDALKITVVGSVNGTAGVRINFVPLLGSSVGTGNCVMRIKGAAVRPYVVNGQWESDIIAGYISITTDADGWSIVSIPGWMLNAGGTGLANIDFLFGVTAGEQADIYVDYITR